MSVACLTKSFIHHYYHSMIIFEKLKYQSCNTQNIRSVRISNHLFETYKNYFMTHGKHMFQTASDTAMAKMRAYPSSNYPLPHWKCVLRFCEKFPPIELPSPESDQYNSNVFT